MKKYDRRQKENVEANLNQKRKQRGLIETLCVGSHVDERDVLQNIIIYKITKTNQAGVVITILYYDCLSSSKHIKHCVKNKQSSLNDPHTRPLVK
jgi:hypothetical protein